MIIDGTIIRDGEKSLKSALSASQVASCLKLYHKLTPIKY